MVALYASGGHTIAVVDDPYGPARVVDLDTGELHGLYADGDALRASAPGWATRGRGRRHARPRRDGARA